MTRLVSLCALVAGMWVSVGALHGEPPVLPDASEVETFATPESMTGWSFSNGPEWPGATGSLEYSKDRGRSGDGALLLRYNFENGGNYVAAIGQVPQGRDVVGFRFWANKPSANLIIIRAVDNEGETFQKDLRYHYAGWQQVEIRLDSWSYHWGGDAKYQNPTKQIDILLEHDGGDNVGYLLIDDFQWIYKLEKREESGAKKVRYLESDFVSGLPWSLAGPTGDVLREGSWAYRFSEGQDGIGLYYRRSILGKPESIKLTVESDGSGHELTASCGSHFQGFHKVLGVLDKKGEQSFEVPMGDMSSWRHDGGENDGIVRYPLRLENLGIKKKGDGDSGQIRLKKLEFETSLDGQEVFVEPSVVQQDGDKLRFDVRVRSLGSKEAKGRLVYSLNTIDSTLSEGTIDLIAPSGGLGVSKSIDAAFGSYTMLEGRFRFVTEHQSTPVVTTTIARAQTAGADHTLNPDSRMGVGMYLYRFHGHLQAREWMDRMCRLASAAGVKWTREEFHWNWVEATKGQYDFSFFDQLVESANSHGISVYGLVCYWTEWTGQPMTEEFIDHYCNYLRVLVGRYKHSIKHWEIWNEPNIFFWPGPKELYPKLLAKAYETIKEVDPEAQVLGCSTAGIDVSFIKLTLDAKAPFDALTVHPYRHTLDAAKFVKELRDTREMVGGRDVWITEMGWPSCIGGLTERQQAAYVARTYISALASGAARSVAWYDFREDGVDPYYNEYHFGLIRQDLTPKIGYRALAAVGQLLGKATHDRDLEPGDGATGYLFRAGEKRVAALWCTDRTRIVSLKVAGSNAKVLNAMAEPARTYNHEGELVLLLEKHLPIYVVADGPLKVSLKDDGMKYDIRPHRDSYHPGDTLTLNMPYGEGVSVEPRLLPRAWRLIPSDDGAIRIAIPPSTAPGRYVLEYLVSPRGKGTEPAFEIPLEVEIVAGLLNG